MPAYGGYLRKTLSSLIFGSGSFAKPTTVAVALCSGVPTASDTGSSLPEVSGSGYARAYLAGPGVQGFIPEPPAGGVVANPDVLTFGPALDDWGPVRGAAVLDSESPGAGNVLFFCELSPYKDVGRGDVFAVPAEGMTVDADVGEPPMDPAPMVLSGEAAVTLTASLSARPSATWAARAATGVSVGCEPHPDGVAPDTLLTNSDFTFLGAFRPPRGREPQSTGRTVVGYVNAGQMTIPSDDPGIPPGGFTVFIEITDGPYLGWRWWMTAFNAGLVSVYDTENFRNVPEDIAGYGYKTYIEHDNLKVVARAGQNALAVRRVNGEVRLAMCTGVSSQYPYEFVPPAEGSLSKSTDWHSLPTCETGKCWGSVIYDGSYGSYDGVWTKGITSSTAYVMGLTWAHGMLWANYGSDYVTPAHGNSPHVMAMAVDGNNDLTRYGPWRFNGVSFKRAMNQVLEVPDYFAQQLGLAGDYILNTGGGYFSLFDQGGGSGGLAAQLLPVPSLVAYDPALDSTDDGNSDIPYLSVTPLLGYDAVGTGTSLRPGDYINRSYITRFTGGTVRAVPAANKLTLWVPDGTVYGTWQAPFNNPQQIVITGGPGAGQARTIVQDSFDSATSTVTLTSDWTTLPVAGSSTYELIDGTVVSAASASQVTLSVAAWDLSYFFKVLSGPAAGDDERTLTHVSGFTYNVSPPLSATPQAGDMWRIYGKGYPTAADAVDANTGYWMWGDEIQAAAWVYGDNKHGVLCFPSLCSDYAWYQNSDLRGRGVRYWWFCYDPADIKAVYDGDMQPDEPVPTWWEAEYRDASNVLQKGYLQRPSPDFEYDTYEYGSAYNHAVCGAAFDPVAKRLYLLVFLYPDNQNGYYVINVYSVNC